MGTWGTAIKDNDAFADIYGDFFEFYNKGEQPEIISEKILSQNWEMFEIEEEVHSLWFALALAQWETKSLDLNVFNKVEQIIVSEADLKLWKKLEATEQEIRKRKIALDKFLEKLKSEKPKAKPRKKVKYNTPIFSTGDCLIFKLSNGNYGGAVVIGTDSNPETANNLIATTRLNQSYKPNLKDFENAEVLFKNFESWDDKELINWYSPDLFKKNYSHFYENIGSISIDFEYKGNNYEGKGYLFKPMWAGGWTTNIDAERQFESELIKPKPAKNLTIKQLTKKGKWWKIF